MFTVIVSGTSVTTTVDVGASSYLMLGLGATVADHMRLGLLPGGATDVTARQRRHLNTLICIEGRVQEPVTECFSYLSTDDLPDIAPIAVTALNGRTGNVALTRADMLAAGSVSVVSVPATAGSTGTTGQIAFNATHVYICVATDTWVRAALSSF